MKSAPVRFLIAALWPLAIWGSLTHLEEHPADDYVERTSPIVAFAIAFWVCLVAVAGLEIMMSPRIAIVSAGDAEAALTVRDLTFRTLANVLWAFLPMIYLVGLWLFTSRDERYPR